VFFEIGNFKEALKFLEISSSDSALFLQARIYMSLGQLGKAHHLLEHVGDTTHPRLAKFKLSLARQSGNQESEIQALEELLNHQCSPKDRAGQLYRLGNLYCKVFDYERAFKVFHSLQALIPGNLKVLRLRIHCLEQAQNFQKAFDLCKKFHRRSPFDVENLKTGVRLAINLNKEDEAYFLLKGAWLCGVKDLGLKTQLAELALKRLDSKEAKRVLESVLEESGADSRVYGLMATAWELEGNLRISAYYRELMHKFSTQSAA
jgi:tetratricopeptide (TPR) repeat protein